MTMGNSFRKPLEELLKLLYEKASAAKTKSTSNIMDPYIIAADGGFLGVITADQSDQDSIFNEYGIYGSRYSDHSIFNRSGKYGSEDSAYSPFNRHTSTPPKIFHQGKEIAYLTRNPHMTNWIDPDSLFEETRSEPCPEWSKLFNELKRPGS